VKRKSPQQVVGATKQALAVAEPLVEGAAAEVVALTILVPLQEHPSVIAQGIQQCTCYNDNCWLYLPRCIFSITISTPLCCWQWCNCRLEQRWRLFLSLCQQC
jgi:hypothetical protein